MSNETPQEQYSCICGDNFIKVDDGASLYNGNDCICDQCNSKANSNDIIWHCEQKDNHPNGFDICNNCISSFDVNSFNTKHSKQKPTIINDTDKKINNYKELDEFINQNQLNSEPNMPPDDYTYLLHDGFIRNRSMNCNVKECLSLNRICKIFKKYNACIKQANNCMANIYDAIGDKYDDVMFLNDYNHLLLDHEAELEVIYNFLIQNCIDNICVVATCTMFQRNRRDRSNMKASKSLYNTENITDIIRQQLLDRAHCHFFHTFDIGYRLTMEEINIFNTGNIEMKGDDEENVDINAAVKKVDESLHSKHKLLDITQQNNKFAPPIHITPEVSPYSYGVRYFYWKYYEHLIEVYDPVHSQYNKASIGAGMMGDLSLMRLTLHNDGFTVENIHNQATANEDKSVGYWYVAEKYASLKEELLDNGICVIRPYQYNQLHAKAVVHQQSEKVRKMICIGGEYAYCNTNGRHTVNVYEVEKNKSMSIDHLIAIMVQCNFDVLQNKLRQTYRKLPVNETDQHLKQRHRNFYWMGRRLRECVECFGMEGSFKKGDGFSVWHGVNTQCTFECMYAYIKGPCSTTTSYSVATNFSGNTGMLLQMEMDDDWLMIEDDEISRMTAFSCAWISDYSNESEIFTIGGLYRFKFINILDAASSTNYKHYIKGIIQMSYGMSLDMAETDVQRQVTFRLISHELYRYYPNHKYAYKFDSCPEFISNILLHKHCLSITKIVFPENNAEQKQILLMFKTNDGWINCDLLLTIFPNLKQIYYNAKKHDISFVKMHSIYKSVLDFINRNPQTSLLCIELNVNDEWKDAVCQFWHESSFQNMISQFNQVEWNLELKLPGDISFGGHQMSIKMVNYKHIMQCIREIPNCLGVEGYALQNLTYNQRELTFRSLSHALYLHCPQHPKVQNYKFLRWRARPPFRALNFLCSSMHAMQ